MSARSHREWFEHDPGYAEVPRAIRPLGSTGATLVQVSQPPGFYARAGADEFSINVFEKADKRSEVNVGGYRSVTSLSDRHFGVVPANEHVSFENEGSIEATVVLLPRRKLREVCVEYGVADSVDFAPLIPADRHNPLIHSIVTGLGSPRRDPGRLERLFAESAVNLLTVELIRESGQAQPTLPGGGGLAPWQLKRVRDAMEAQLDGDPGLDELAAIAGLSPSHFSRAFKQSAGVSPFTWLRARRIERAKELLADPKLSLAEAALAVGFSAQPEFTTAFKRATGVTPGAWRRERLQ